MSSPLVSVMRWLSGRILRVLKSGSVLALCLDFEMVLIVFFCIAKIEVTFFCEVQLNIGRPYSKCGWMSE